MGVDIHMHIISKDGTVKYEDIFDGRDYDWFANLTGHCTDDSYRHFPYRVGIPENVPANIKEYYDCGMRGCYYDFCYVNVGDFYDWYETARPDIRAGWLTTYERWLYTRKNIVPEELPRELDPEWNANDYHFTEVEFPYEPSRWLIEFFDNHLDIGIDDYVVYYFDC